MGSLILSAGSGESHVKDGLLNSPPSKLRGAVMLLIYLKCLCVGLFQFESGSRERGESLLRNEEHELMLGPSVCSPKSC